MAERDRDHYRRLNVDRRFLQSREWRERIRPRQLARSPMCEHCHALGHVTLATEVDHIRRPLGDRTLQRDPDNFQSLCDVHHNAKSHWERRNDGKPLRIGHDLSGWPIDLPGGAVKR